ncbi:hypothetical protein [Bradyrhizobium yuanmingense]|uniref:Transcriptional regulator n=1 Tax=Bradyrhizobium yuanmingense TaxID=108015 RepID=A0ABV4G857_9BRAD|nr:hypothetical protein [Bradyrhizobium yuanmingense]
MSRTFPTGEEALEKADEAGLVEHAEGEAVLEDELRIRPCPADPEPCDDGDLIRTPVKPAS